MRNRKNLRDKTGRRLTRYSFGLYDDNAEYKDVKAVLDDIEGVGALLKDAVFKYVRSDAFELERYEGPGHRKGTK
jgi:hypothetical protein